MLPTAQELCFSSNSLFSHHFHETAAPFGKQDGTTIVGTRKATKQPQITGIKGVKGERLHC